MFPLEYNLEAETLNTTYNSIKNCRVVQPPFEKDGYYSNEFFLDKRFWLTEYKVLSWMRITDDIIIDWIRYYYYQDLTANKSYIGCWNWITFVNITPSWFNIDSNSPLKIVKGKWIIWPTDSEWRHVLVPEAWEDDWTEFNWTLIPSYAWWYIKFKYHWVQTVALWDYIYFKDWALAWWLNRVEYIDWDYVFIIWTNIRGTIPRTWAKFELFKKTNTKLWPNIVVWHKDWISVVTTNWYTAANVLKVHTPSSPIIDIVWFDWNIFALTNSYVTFSRTTTEDNTQFYPLDMFEIYGWEKLFPMWKVMLLFWDENKLYVPININVDDVTYWEYEVNYDWNNFSKYSMIFADQTIYILQEDNQLKQVDIQQRDSTSYDLIVKEVLVSTKWLFNSLSWWEMFINSNQRFLNFLYLKDWKTINYQYDKMYKHFIEQEYNVPIYKFTDHILSNWKIYTETWYTDDWEEYNQEINFLDNTKFKLHKPVILRTIFWLTDNLFKVNLKIEFEIWAKLDIIEKELSNFDFDNRLSETLTWDELLEEEAPEEQITYDWSIASIQSNILKVWRFIRFKYYSSERFMIWNSYIIADESKTFINEPLLTN